MGGEDRWWHDKVCFDQEQARQGRQQEDVRQGQAEQVDCCCPEGKEGTERQGIRRDQEGITPLQEGAGALPVRVLTTVSAQGVGISTPFERFHYLNSIECVEYH